MFCLSKSEIRRVLGAINLDKYVFGRRGHGRDVCCGEREVQITAVQRKVSEVSIMVWAVHIERD